MDYQNGKIYTIRSHLTDEFYIGSTTQSLTKRLSKHKYDYKYWKVGKRSYTTSFKIIEFGDAYIELLEECPCANKMLLHKREGELIRENTCVNKFIAGRTPKQYRKDNKESHKQYRKDNKDKISENEKERYKKNKDKILEKNKEIYQKNKDKIIEENKKLIECQCGSVSRKSDIARHNKTKKHKFYEEIYNFIHS